MRSADLVLRAACVAALFVTTGCATVETLLPKSEPKAESAAQRGNGLFTSGSTSCCGTWQALQSQRAPTTLSPRLPGAFRRSV